MAPARQRWRTVVRELGLTFITAGVVVLLFVAFDLWGTSLAEQRSQSRLAREFHHSLHAHPAGTSTTGIASTTTPRQTTTTVAGGKGGGKTKGAGKAKGAGGKAKRGGGAGGGGQGVQPLPLVPPGGALDHLVMPAIGVNRYVVEGTTAADLQMGPGHYLGTPLPGQAGNVAIAGHRTTFGAPFFELNNMVAGDLVYLTDVNGDTWVYRVRQQWVVAPTDMAVVAPATGELLTLTTCNPRFEATSRLVVRAVLFKHYRSGAKLPDPLPARAGGAPKGASPPSTLPPSPTTTATRAPKVSSTTSTTSTSPTSSTGPSRTGTTSADNPVVSGPSGRGGTGHSKQPNPGTLGGGGPAQQVQAVGWGAMAIGLWAITRVAANRRRLLGPKAVVVVLGALVCLVPLWFAFENIVDLLPANI